MKNIKSISFIVRNDPALLNNKIFDGESLYGMKSDNYPFKGLKEYFNTKQIGFNTFDITPPAEADMIICLDEVNTFKKIGVFNKPSFLIISEPPVYAQDNWNPINHTYFEKVFTYDKDLILSDKYVHYIFAIDFESHQKFDAIAESDFKKRKLCCLIAGALQIEPPKTNDKSLLFERFKTANYFAKNHATDFDIFGRNLINEKFEYFKGASLLKKFKLHSILKSIAKRKAKNILKSYKGSIPALEKLNFQNRYNFSICYDNSAISGCISERIFDCFISKSVPIYTGAPDIKSYIPKECFIDRNDFSSYSELYKFMKTMNYSTYLNYLNAIESFLSSDKTAIFTTKNYVNTIITNLHLENTNI